MQKAEVGMASQRQQSADLHRREFLHHGVDCRSAQFGKAARILPADPPPKSARRSDPAPQNCAF